MKAKDGDTVKVNYTGKLKDGTVFDKNEKDNPLQFTIGSGQIIKGFNDAVINMETGEKKTVEISQDMAYGPYMKDMVITVDREHLPKDMNPKVNEQLYVEGNDGRKLLVTVVKTEKDSITLDANHPLAGKDLIFDIELIDIA